MLLAGPGRILLGAKRCCEQLSLISAVIAVPRIVFYTYNPRLVWIPDYRYGLGSSGLPRFAPGTWSLMAL
jgi:hypothetical protein